LPQVRPFRALRYDAQAVGDLALVVAPPSDVISADWELRLLERHPVNVVRLDLPPAESGKPDDRYRRTPAASVIAVAAAGDVMPQTSTDFYPKALTGLVINPHEW